MSDAQTQLDNTLKSKVDVNAPRFKSNQQALLTLLGAMKQEQAMLDPERRSFWSLGLFAAHGMYEEWGGAPVGGCGDRPGPRGGRLVMVIANDATVKAGAFFPMTAKKVLRAQTIAIENRIPTLYLVDSSGVFCRCRKMYFPTRMISGASSATTP
jgi:3-methylcrotonyl-CoA carboxylase beta subunit